MAAPDYFSGNLRTISYFDFRSLRKATKNFNPVNLLGSGGFGPVYKGKLGDGRAVAVKKLSLKSEQDGSQRLLVYEYMKNGSLDSVLFGKVEHFLNWSTRYQIILGIARGLQYLHEDSHIRIVHRDIKASNILLDERFQPKIGDFGLARFFPEDEAYLSTNFAGTLGYTAPEYAIRGELSEKADIYSFGVIVLEIISCRRNTDLSLSMEMQYLPEYAWKLYERSRVTEIVDPKLQKDGFVEKDVLQAIHVAFLCLQPDPSLRPPMSDIVAMLTCKVNLVSTPTPVKPVFLGRKTPNSDNDIKTSTLHHTSRETVSTEISYPSPLLTDSTLSINVRH
ncbi:hypothetical protein MKW98_012644 [Papaver atlanticum]|uniref:Protein kinase domain-containing protein n=1 Tax=Papaver atlanticum TaxID=357466 RepID=A0AAD4T2P5_9MAGN|nr:hypothetical protein MKW98_012644 [Papaver atlanticum]